MSCGKKLNDECCNNFIREDLDFFDENFRKFAETEAIAQGLLFQANIVADKIIIHSQNLPTNFPALENDIDKFTPIISQAINVIVDEANTTTALIDILSLLQYDLLNCVFSTNTKENNIIKICNDVKKPRDTIYTCKNNIILSNEIQGLESCSQDIVLGNIQTLTDNIQEFQNLVAENIGFLDTLKSLILELNRAVLQQNITTTQSIAISIKELFILINNVDELILPAFDSLYQEILNFSKTIITCGFVESCINKSFENKCSVSQRCIKLKGNI